jgi:hypothetical protein
MELLFLAVRRTEMNCRYRIGDVILQLAMAVAVLAISIRLGIEEHQAWFAIPGGLFLVSMLGSYLNSREREQDKIKASRAQRQIALGVPPDEV